MCEGVSWKCVVPPLCVDEFGVLVKPCLSGIGRVSVEWCVLCCAGCGWVLCWGCILLGAPWSNHPQVCSLVYTSKAGQQPYITA